MLHLDDYQEISRAFLLARKFALLADEPGVGKTAPTIVAAHEQVQATRLPALVTAPAYLLPNWEWEIGRFAPGATVAAANGTGRQSREEALGADADFILTSYNNWSARHKEGEPPELETSYPELVTRQWGVCVYDEGHRLRGRNSRATKQVFQLRRRLSANRETPLWFLSGTPIVNNPGDLYPLFHLWKSRDYKSYWKFVDRWCDVVQTPWAKEVKQIRKGLEEEFQEVMAEFTLRRTLKDIPKLSDLDAYHKHYFVTLPASVRKMIAKAKKEYILEHPDLDQAEFLSGSGALYARLCKLATTPPTAANPKVDLCLDFLSDHPGRVVIYTWYKDSASTVAARLGKAGRPVRYITGDTPSASRQAIVDEWSHLDGAILVATIASLKEGISLVAANSVIFLEHSPLPADQEQCVARLKRRGQTDVVGVHHVWARGTPDVAIKRSLYDREEGLSRALTSWLLDDEA